MKKRTRRKKRKKKKKDAKEDTRLKREETALRSGSRGDRRIGKMDVAIYGLGAMAAIGLALFGVFYSSHKTAAIWWVFFPSLVVLSLAVCLFWQQQVWKEEAARRAASQAKASENSTVPTPPPKLEEPTFREKVEKVSFSLGGGGVHIVYDLSGLEKMPREPFNFGGFSPVKVYVENGTVYADVTVYGGTGLPPIEIKHNEFVKRPLNWDSNSSVRALEIVNENQFPIFQLIYKTQSHIVVNGVFPSPSGLILANEERTVFMPTLPTTFSLKRIFKYPSWKYPGQYNTRTEKLNSD